MPSGMQTREWLVPSEPKIQWPALPPQTGPPREQQDQAKPQCKLPPWSQQGSGTCSREKGSISSLVACLSPLQTLESGQAQPRLERDTRSRALPRRAAASWGCQAVSLCLATVTRGGWRGGDTTLALLPPRPQQAEQGEAEQGRALCWHAAAAAATAGTCWGWGGDASTPRGAGGCLGIAQQHSAPAAPSAAAGGRAQSISWHKEAAMVLTYSEKRCVQSAWDPMALMGHGPLATFICPTTFCPWEMTVNSVSQRLKLSLWPSTPCIKYICWRKTCRYCRATTMVCWWQGLKARTCG